MELVLSTAQVRGFVDAHMYKEAIERADLIFNKTCELGFIDLGNNTKEYIINQDYLNSID